MDSATNVPPTTDGATVCLRPPKVAISVSDSWVFVSVTFFCPSCFSSLTHSQHPAPRPAPRPRAGVAAPGLLRDLAKLPPRESLPGAMSPGKSQQEREETENPRWSERAAAAAPETRLDEEAFLAALREDECGTDVLRSSVEGFTRDTLALEVAIAKAREQQHQQQ